MFNNWPNFDELMKLANEKPELLEALRKQKINEIIDNAPADMRHRLRGLQFQIDCQRRIHKTPLASCLSISKMMCDSLNKLNDVLNGNKQQVSKASKSTETGGTAKSRAEILTFPVAG